MSDKHSPAFPTITWDQLLSGQFAQVTENIGVTKLEFFACNAPNEIPGWFKHTPPDIDVAIRPDCAGMAQKDIDVIRCWHDSDDVLGESLPDHLKWYAVQFTLHIQEQAEYNEIDRKERYFQWRRYYAEQLLLTISTPQP